MLKRLLRLPALFIKIDISSLFEIHYHDYIKPNPQIARPDPYPPLPYHYAKPVFARFSVMPFVSIDITFNGLSVPVGIKL